MLVSYIIKFYYIALKEGMSVTTNILKLNYYYYYYYLLRWQYSIVNFIYSRRIYQTWIIRFKRIYRLKNAWNTTLGCKDNEIRKSEFEAMT